MRALAGLALIALMLPGLGAASGPPKKWCGKCYEKENINNPQCKLSHDTFFKSAYPDDYTPTLLSCNGRFNTYEYEDLAPGVEIIVDAGQIFGTFNEAPAKKSRRNVTIYDAEDQPLVTQEIDYPSRGNLLFVTNGTKLVSGPGERSRTVTYNCTLDKGADENDVTLKAQGNFDLWPLRTNGTLVNIDMLMSAVKTRHIPFQDGYNATKFFPFGFYTSWDWLMSQDLDTALTQMAKDGLTMIHPVPDYGKVADGDPASVANVTRFLDAAFKAGLHVAYDLRSTYMNKSAIATQINAIKYHPALLTIYTADEPDQGDPLSATTTAYDLVRSLEFDGGAHPVSLVLNCNDFEFDHYARGADILAQDAYPVSVNTTFSRRWNTTCTTGYGDCGCDQCSGFNNLSDSTVRNLVFQQRLQIMEAEQNAGRESNGAIVRGRTPVWAVLQGFGAPEEYWPRGPTIDEFVVMAVGSFARGATGIMPWQYSIATDDIRRTATRKVADFIAAISKPVLQSYGPKGTKAFRLDDINATLAKGVDVGGWRIDDGRVVLILANPGNGEGGKYPTQDFKVNDLPASDNALSIVFNSHQGKGAIDFRNGTLTGRLAPLQALVVILGTAKAPQ